MKLSEVTNAEQAKRFILFPVELYKDDPNYIRPLDADVEGVFHSKTNKYCNDDTTARWLLYGDDDKVIGRIAAFVNASTSSIYEQRTGGLGFFECINNKEAAFKLFDTARTWLKEQGMEAMNGPVNLGSRERWWGLLVDGFHPPCYCSNYNPPWYRNFFEEYGFKLFFKQYTYLRTISRPLKDIYYKIADRIRRNSDYSFKTIEINRIQKYIDDFHQVYNEAWINHEGVSSMSKADVHDLFDTLKPVIDEKIAWFTYYRDQPVGFFLCIPELNELLVRYANGKPTIATKLRLLYNKLTGSCKTMYGLIFGMIPSFQKKGLEVAMIVAAEEYLKKHSSYRYIQMNWIGDFNPRMMSVAEQIEAEVYKTHTTYRYLFDRTIEFRRHHDI